MQDFAWWLNTFIGEAGEKLGGKDKESIIEKCGRVCFQSCNITGAISDIKKKTNDMGEMLAELNKAGIGGGNLKIEGDTISGVYEKCYCPYRNALGESITPEFCNCTRGWAKSLLEQILDRPVEVELLQSIGKGDPVCKFAAKLG
jgi:predicted hydrocarbon binding protein